MTLRASRSFLVLPLLILAACAQTKDLLHLEKDAGANGPSATISGTSSTGGTAAADAAGTAPPIRAAIPKANAKTVAQLDTTTPAQKAEAAKTPATGERKLGATVASLGDPTQPGFWIKTPLVKAPSKGRIVNPANGKSVKVDLMPLAGPTSGGSQVSLPALQLIGVSLTDLPSIDVYQN